MKFDNNNNPKNINFKEVKKEKNNELSLIDNEELEKRIDEYNFQRIVHDYDNLNIELKKRLFHYITSNIENKSGLINKENKDLTNYDWY